MNPNGNTSGNPYGLSSTPRPSSIPVPPRPTNTSTDGIISPITPVAVPPIAQTPVPAPSVAPVPLSAIPTPLIEPDMPTPSLSTETPAADPSLSASTPAPSGPTEPGLSETDLSIAKLETEPDTSPTNSMPSAAPIAPAVPIAPVEPLIPDPAPVAPTPIGDSGIAASVNAQFFEEPKHGKSPKLKGAPGISFSLSSMHMPNKKVLIIVGIVVLLAGLAAAYFFVVAPMLASQPSTPTNNSNTPTQNETPEDTTPTEATVERSAIDEVGTVYTNSATNEANLANTDDTNYANDAGSAAAGVGDSVNEANF